MSPALHCETAADAVAAARRAQVWRREIWGRPPLLVPAPAPTLRLAPSSTMTPRQIIEAVIAASAAAQRVTVDDVMGRSRRRPFSLARMAAMVVLRRHTKMSFPHIGSIFHRDHTTILSACRKAENCRKLKKAVARLEEAAVKLLDALPKNEGRPS
jgi:hypothetical protein